MTHLTSTDKKVATARRWVLEARHVLVAAGAGMGVDSGLPDFRGPEGFWRHYPHFRHRRWTFEQVASPEAFLLEPELAWGFYGHRIRLYRTTQPHDGFQYLREALNGKSAFVVTTNVDGQFQKSGWPKTAILEQHGNIHWLQCSKPCNDHLWPADSLEAEVNSEGRWVGNLPRCEHCGSVARPNVLMFSDGCWVAARREAQRPAFRDWMADTSPDGLLVLEIGAGRAVPTLRQLSERLHRQGARLVRINPRDQQVPVGALGLAMGAFEALKACLATTPA